MKISYSRYSINSSSRAKYKLPMEISKYFFSALLLNVEDRVVSILFLSNQTIETSQNKGGCFLGKQRRNNRRAPAISKSNSVYLSIRVSLLPRHASQLFVPFANAPARFTDIVTTESIWISSQSRFTANSRIGFKLAHYTSSSKTLHF